MAMPRSTVPRAQLLRRGLHAAAVAGLLALAACGPTSPPAETLRDGGEWHEFQGTWTAAGSRHRINLGSDRRASIADLEGSLLLAGPARPAVGFRAEAIVLNDSATGMVGRSVWTDEHGDQVYSELRGEGTATGNRIVGTFIGGTGRYSGATGIYEFSWRFVLESEDGEVQGQSIGLQGRVRVGAPPAKPGAGRTAAMISPGLLVRRAVPFALAIGIWFTPVPAGLTAPAWHLFAVFVSAIVAVLVNAFPLLTSTMLAVAAVVLTGTISPAKAFGGFANASVLLVVIAFLVAQAVVKSGLGRRISLFMVSRFGRSSLGLAYSIVLTDAVIAPAFPSNTARGGVLFPIVLSVAQGSGSRPEDAEGRRLGGYLMFCAMASLAVSSALWMTATSANPIGIQVAREFGLEIGFGKWLVVASVPALSAILVLPWFVARLFPPGVGETPDAPVAARAELAALGPLSRDERITAVAFVLMVSGWIFADKLQLNVTSVAFAGLGLLLMTNVLTLDDIAAQGDTLATFLWLAVLFALSGQLNELGFMGYAGQRLASHLGGLSWPVTYVTLVVLYVAIHYMFVSQSSQVLALMGVFLDVGIRGGVPAPLMAFALLFASSYFSVITPQGGSQNVIFVGSGYLTQPELYRLGLLMTLFFLAVFLVIGTPWILLITG